MQTAATYNLTPDLVLVISRMLHVNTLRYSSNFSWFMQHSTISCWFMGNNTHLYYCRNNGEVEIMSCDANLASYL